MKIVPLMREHADAVGLLGLAVVAGLLAVSQFDDASPRTWAAATLATCIAAAVTTAAVRVPWRQPRPSRAEQQQVLADLPAEPVARGRRLHTQLRRLASIQRLLGLTVAVALGLTQAGAGLVTAAGRPFGGHWTVQAAAGVLAVVAVGWAAGLPVSALRHRQLMRYELTHLTWAGWIGERIAMSLFGGAVLVVVTVAFYAIGHASPQWWWAWAAALEVAVLVLLTGVFPTVFAPVSNRFTPMRPGPLRQRLLTLADHDHIPITDVLVTDGSRRSRKAGAYVAGLGKGRRVVVFDTLLRQPPAPDEDTSTHVEPLKPSYLAWDTMLPAATDAEVGCVVAHELAHVKHRDLAAKVTISTLTAVATVCGLCLLDGWPTLLHAAGVGSITDPRALALLILFVKVTGLATNPALTLISRRVEARADQHALTTTDDPAAMESLWQRLTEINVVDVDPPATDRLWHGTHPSIVERIAAARAYAPARTPTLVQVATAPYRDQ